MDAWLVSRIYPSSAPWQGRGFVPVPQMTVFVLQHPRPLLVGYQGRGEALWGDTGRHLPRWPLLNRQVTGLKMTQAAP